MYNFNCNKCRMMVPITPLMGTKNRNHCPFCLWSKHVDQDLPGDRKSDCQSLMEPVGLTFKQVGLDKWGKPNQGELMLIHRCPSDQKISINRLASDDDPSKVLEVFKNSFNLDTEVKQEIAQNRISLLTDKDQEEVERQLRSD